MEIEGTAAEIRAALERLARRRRTLVRVRLATLVFALALIASIFVDALLRRGEPLAQIAAGILVLVLRSRIRLDSGGRLAVARELADKWPVTFVRVAFEPTLAPGNKTNEAKGVLTYTMAWLDVRTKDVRFVRAERAQMVDGPSRSKLVSWSAIDDVTVTHRAQDYRTAAPPAKLALPDTMNVLELDRTPDTTHVVVAHAGDPDMPWEWPDTAQKACDLVDRIVPRS